jgi:hypothetical protein
VFVCPSLSNSVRPWRSRLSEYQRASHFWNHPPGYKYPSPHPSTFLFFFLFSRSLFLFVLFSVYKSNYSNNCNTYVGPNIIHLDWFEVILKTYWWRVWFIFVIQSFSHLFCFLFCFVLFLLHIHSTVQMMMKLWTHSRSSSWTGQREMNSGLMNSFDSCKCAEELQTIQWQLFSNNTITRCLFIFFSLSFVFESQSVPKRGILFSFCWDWSFEMMTDAFSF